MMMKMMIMIILILMKENQPQGHDRRSNGGEPHLHLLGRHSLVMMIIIHHHHSFIIHCHLLLIIHQDLCPAQTLTGSSSSPDRVGAQ